MDIPPELQFNYDPEQAKTMLDSAGITDTNGDGNREFEGQELNLEILFDSDVAGSVDTGKLLQSYMTDVGVGSFITTVNTNKAYSLWGDGTFDVYVGTGALTRTPTSCCRCSPRTSASGGATGATRTPSSTSSTSPADPARPGRTQGDHRSEMQL